MKLVLLSGGSGKRLWPLSNESRSKQFLKTIKTENDEMESMLQRVWRQLGRKKMVDAAYISTSIAHVDMITCQLGNDIPLIIEPERRDTYPAIVLAAAYFYSELGVDLNEVITVMPVDPYTDHHFFDKVKELEDAIRRTNADIALIGVHPAYPSEKHGYIIPDRDAASMHNPYIAVHSFKEKPSEDEAIQFIRRRALWNCGVFSFRLGYLIKLLETKKIPLRYDQLIEQYDKLPKISFDYEVVEKAERVVAIPFQGTWRDLGTWDTLTSDFQTKVIGKGVISEDSSNTHLINELDIPIAILGVSNIVVAASPDGVLVSDKSASHRVKDFVKPLEQRPMFEERRWGWYRVLDYQTSEDGTEIMTKRLCITAGKNLSYQYHLMRSEVWTIVSGTGEFVLEDQMVLVSAGDVFKIPTGAKHGIKAITELEIIEVQMGTRLIEEDIVRLYTEWDDLRRALG
ncbi:sugar phosphate nucleotidyltransferase [Brevibacillus borstelensis]|uniref:sugar phosphate nucleotidyltransferase n=1 Tax=Brevibacillus borstelensis TaxID=45462 RepID=UPI0030C5E616